MRWTELNIGGYQAKITKVTGIPLIEVPEGYVDREGNEVTEEVLSKREAVWKNKNGNIIEEKFKLINGKVMNKFKLIKEIPKERIKETDKTEAYDLITESVYLVECEPLKEKLLENDKAFKFHFSNGNGYKIYIAYVTSFMDNLVMYLGIDALTNGLQQISKVKSAKVSKIVKEEVARANDLIATL